MKGKMNISTALTSDLPLAQSYGEAQGIFCFREKGAVHVFRKFPPSQATKI